MTRSKGAAVLAQAAKQSSSTSQDSHECSLNILLVAAECLHLWLPEHALVSNAGFTCAYATLAGNDGHWSVCLCVTQAKASIVCQLIPHVVSQPMPDVEPHSHHLACIQD